MSKKYISALSFLVVVLIGSGLYYLNYKKSHPVGESILPVSSLPVATPTVAKDNLIITPAPITTSAIVVKTTQDQVIKDIVDGKYDQAKIELKPLLVATPQNAELWYINSSLQELQSDNAGAVVSINKALVFDPMNAVYWKWKVALVTRQMVQDKILNTSSSYITAVKNIYIDALKATNSNIEILTPYAIYLESIGDKTGAIALWEKAITVNPTAKTSYQTQIDRIKAL